LEIYALLSLQLVFTNDARETLPWLDLLLEVSGAAKTLDQLLNVLEPKMAEISNKLHSAILALEQVEKRFNQLEGILKRKEGKKKEEKGIREWTFLNEKEAKAMGTEGSEILGKKCEI
jgi:predicted mannosyl-3-phosphoglycerate phosphatase (HAD superfamily)